MHVQVTKAQIAAERIKQKPELGISIIMQFIYISESANAICYEEVVHMWANIIVYS